MNIITGFHRSGTSALAGACFHAGLPMGEKDSMVLDQSDNPKGHWEHIEYLRINNKLLIDNGGSWDKPRPLISIPIPIQLSMKEKGMDGLLVKDPRFCLTARMWEEFMPIFRAFVMLRNPFECIRSLEARSPGTKFSTSLWIKYNESLLEWLTKKNKSVMVIEYDFLLDHPSIVSDMVRRFLSVHPDDFDHKAFVGFIEKRLKHHDSNGKIPIECRDLYGQLLSLGEKTYESISGKP